MIHKFNKFNESSDEDENVDEGMEYILYLLRNTIKNKGIKNFEIDNFEEYNISITVTTNLRERLSELNSIFEVIANLKKDIIPQYESEFFMYIPFVNNIALIAGIIAIIIFVLINSLKLDKFWDKIRNIKLR